VSKISLGEQGQRRRQVGPGAVAVAEPFACAGGAVLPLLLHHL